MIPKETVELIIETSRIEEVVGDFVSLKKISLTGKGITTILSDSIP